MLPTAGVTPVLGAVAGSVVVVVVVTAALVVRDVAPIVSIEIKNDASSKVRIRLLDIKSPCLFLSVQRSISRSKL